MTEKISKGRQWEIISTNDTEKAFTVEKGYDGGTFKESSPKPPQTFWDKYIDKVWVQTGVAVES